MTHPASYLGGMTSEQRALAAVETLKAHISLVDVYAGGWLQFCRIARPIYRNYGFGRADLQRIWWMIAERAQADLRRMRVH